MRRGGAVAWLLCALVCPTAVRAAQAVTSFTLVNADSDADIGPLNDGDTLNLATLPTRNLNVRANTSPATVGSVRFGLDGIPNYKTENVAPYALAGDNGGNYNPWTPAVGQHTLTATPYTEGGAGGTAGTALTVGFTVVDQAAGASAILYLYGSVPPALAGHQLRLNDAGGKGFSQFAQALRDVGLEPVEALDTTVTLDAATLAQYHVVIFSSNNRRFTAAEQNAVVAFVNAGGGILLFSDSGFGFEEGRASDNDIAQHFNLLIHHDNYGGVYTISQYTQPHFITDGITFKGEGVSMVRVLGAPAVQLAECQGGAKKLHDDDGPIQASDSVLAVAEVGLGRVAVTFDRNTFFNPPGAGTNITEVNNRQYAKNLVVWLARHEPVTTAGTVTGELRKWHKVTLTFDGPPRSEGGPLNPFLDYRLNVTFSKGARSLVVPGYFAADGDAANSSADSGNKWRVHFAPDEEGEWTYAASLRFGTEVAVSDAADAGRAVSFDGATGAFTVGHTDKAAPDLRARGRLDYVGGHYLQFQETGAYFLKCGADAPENFLAYADFDGAFKSDGHKDNLVKTWSAHVGDWQAGDPVWQGGKGKGIVGAVNYLASEGLNAFSFLTLNINGDDQNVFPYTAYGERHRMDCSRLDQWEMVLEHGTRKGMYLHFKTLETENELLLDGGDLGTQRRLYYRELIARFAHHLALNWNLGEEINNASTAQKKAWAQYFWDHDPYRHHIVIHNGANHYDLLGTGSELTGFSLQTNQADFSNVHGQTRNYLDRSDAAGKPWVVACDEPGDASHALRPDNDAGNSHTDGRKNALWGNLMAGGAGLEFYFGYDHAHSDLTCEDWRSRDAFWDYCRYALEFFDAHPIPFWEMHNDNTKSSASNDYCFLKASEIYLVYLKNGGTTSVDLDAGIYNVKWKSPRSGAGLRDGPVTTVSGPGSKSIGNPPAATGSDWLAVVVRQAGNVGALVLDEDTFVADRLNLTGPGPRGVTLRGIDCGDNPQDACVAIQVHPAPAGNGWLRLDGTVAHADGAQPEYQRAPTWAGVRVRGLLPDTAYTFRAQIRNAIGQTSALVALKTWTTSLACDVNRSGGVSALDWAYIKAAILRDVLSWPCDVDGDGDLDADDLDQAAAGAHAP